jgi:hypothetical protein
MIKLRGAFYCPVQALPDILQLVRTLVACLQAYRQVCLQITSARCKQSLESSWITRMFVRLGG